MTFPGDYIKYQTVTIDSTKVSGTSHSDFPVLVDLADLVKTGNDIFDSCRTDGGDIRVTKADGTQLSCDLADINKTEKTGRLWIKLDSLSGSTDTEIKIWYNGTDTTPSTDSTYGAESVWSDYECVYDFVENLDRTDFTSTATLTGALLDHSLIATNAYESQGVHQGVATDGTYLYLVGTDSIIKTDFENNVISTNTTPLSDTGLSGVNHCGDPEYYNGKLYIPVEDYPNSPYDNQHIAVFLASDLSFDTSYDISTQGHEVSSIAYNPDDGRLYVSDYTDGSKLYKYDPSDGSYEGYITLGTSVAEIQGITFFDDYIYIASGDTNIYKHDASDWSQVGIVWDGGSGVQEGICHTDNALLTLVDSVDKIFKLEKVYGWLGLPADGYALISGLSKLSIWTIGVYATFGAGGSGDNQGILSYTEAGSSDNTDRASLVYRRTSTPSQINLWNEGDSWATTIATSPDEYAKNIYHMQHNGTSYRKAFRDGIEIVSETSVAIKPGGAGDGIYLGIEDTSGSEQLVGGVGFVYLTNNILDSDWIATESNNITSTSSFYSVSDEGGGSESEDDTNQLIVFVVT